MDTAELMKMRSKRMLNWSGNEYETKQPFISQHLGTRANIVRTSPMETLDDCRVDFGAVANDIAFRNVNELDT